MSSTAVTNLGDQYEPVERWAMVPHPLTFGGDGASVAIDAQDRVYVFGRGPTPVFVFEEDGTFVTAWGTDEFLRPHGITVDADGFVWVVDDTSHTVQKRTAEGDVVLTLGTPGKAAPWHSGDCFNRPTAVAVHPESKEVYVTDGYGNARVHRFTSDGDLIASWGQSGSGPGEFSLPHDIDFIDADRLVVCDRENFRLQVFDADGGFVTQWHIHHPLSISAGLAGEGLLYVGEMGPPPFLRGAPNLGHRVSIIDLQGEVVGHFGDSLPGTGPRQFMAPHGIAVDSRANVYVADAVASWLDVVWGDPVPWGEAISIRKWVRSW